MIWPIYVWSWWWFCTKSVSANDAHPHFCHFFLVSCWSWLLTIQRRRRELVRLFQLLWAAANWLIGLTRGRGCIICLLTSFSCIPATYFVSLSDLDMFFFLLSCWLSSWSGLDYLASLSWSVWNFGALKVFKLLTAATTTIDVCVTTDCRFNFCLFCQGERVAYIYPDLKTVIQGSFQQVYHQSFK